MNTDSPLLTTRREHLKRLIVGGTGLAAAPSALQAAFTHPASDREVHVFSKHLQWLDYTEMAQTAAKIGFDGVDLTVRPGGHVLPERVEEDLPRAVQAIRRAGLKATLMTTAIRDPEDPLTEKILKTASSLGIRYYRMAWLPYEPGLAIPAALDKQKPKIKALADMNEHYKIHGAYQNHAGTKIGGSIWDIWELIKDLDPKWMGCQFDIRHATVEGGQSWPVRLKLMQSHILTMDIKDFVWGKIDDKWKPVNVPLGEGMVDWKQYMGLLRELDISGVYSLHYEYKLGGAERGKREISIEPSELIAAMEKDLRFFREL